MVERDRVKTFAVEQGAGCQTEQTVAGKEGVLDLAFLLGMEENNRN